MKIPIFYFQSQIDYFLYPTLHIFGPVGPGKSILLLGSHWGLDLLGFLNEISSIAHQLLMI